MRLDGKVALITGGASGMGASEAEIFAREGAKVVVADVLEAEGRKVAGGLGKSGLFVRLDVTSEAGWQEAVAAARSTFGKLDILVNNAGISGTFDPDTLSTSAWDRLMDVNAKGVFLGMKHVIPLMEGAGGGAIVNISSGAGRRGLPFRIGYCSAKAGQVGMTYGMALELAPHNITVNCVAPGAIEGDRIARVIEGQAKQRGMTPEAMRKAMLERSPLKRMATAEDISAAAAFLCSPAARNISGQVLPVNAGEPAG
jgi:NAD(P)-dependent dehydrogenase (short-subunit alcohol dehydrogenase family)